MKTFLKSLLLVPCFLLLSACGGDDSSDEPDINLVDTSLDGTFSQLNGLYSATWAETLDDVKYDMTFTPYASPEYKDITISNGTTVNYTKRVRIFGVVHEVKSYIFSNGYTTENSNNEYLYGIDAISKAPYEIIFYNFSTSGSINLIYGTSQSYYIKSISTDSFELSTSKDGTYHSFGR